MLSPHSSIFYQLLRDYPDRIEWAALCENPAAIDLIRSNMDRVSWRHLVANPAAIDLIESNLDYAFDEATNLLLWQNSAACHLLEHMINTNHYHLTNIIFLTMNPNARDLIADALSHFNRRVLVGTMSLNHGMVDLLEDNFEFINWPTLSTNPAVIHLLEDNLDMIDWNNLSANPAALHLLEANPEKINWAKLSMNPSAIHLLEANPLHINWHNLSMNPAALHLLAANPNRIDWELFCRSNYWKYKSYYDYRTMKSSRQWLRIELSEYLFHPIRITKWLEEGHTLEEYLE